MTLNKAEPQQATKPLWLSYPHSHLFWSINMTRDSQSSRKRSKWYQHYTVQLVLSNFWHCNMMLSSPKVSGHIHTYCWADVHHKQWIAHTWYRYHLPPFTGPKVKKPWQSAHILGRTLVFTFWNMCCQQRYGCYTAGVAPRPFCKA